jgi:hypothetical protein
MPRTIIGRITKDGYQSEAASSELDKARLDDMFAARRAPQSQTDRELFQGKGLLGDQFDGDEVMLDKVINVARSHGYEPNATDFYNGGLARFVGDPLAFIPATGGRGHIRKVCEMTNRSCTGAVEYTAPLREDTTPDVKLAPDLVARTMHEEIQANPDLAHKNKDDLREEIIDKYGAPS